MSKMSLIKILDSGSKNPRAGETTGEVLKEINPFGYIQHVEFFEHIDNEKEVVGSVKRKHMDLWSKFLREYA